MYEFYKKIFLLNLKDYPNIGIDFPITMLLAAISLGLIAVIIIVNFRRNKIEYLIRQLKRHEATTEEGALTLSELKLDTFIFKKLISSEGQLAKLIGRAGEKKYTYEEYIALTKKGEKPEAVDFKTARFYLQKDGEERASQIMEAGAPTVLNTVLLCVLILAVYVCISFTLPSLLNLINDFLAK